MPRIMGVYVIRNMYNGDEYVGSSIDVNDRVCHHFNMLNRQAHFNVHLQRAYDKYGGKPNFSWDILEVVFDRSVLYSIEQFWIDFLRPRYNIDRVTYPTASTKKPFTDEYKQMRKEWWTDERRKAWSEYKKGKPSPRKGQHHSDEAKDKISLVQSQRIHPIRMCKDGIIYEFLNLSRFCREQNLERRKVRWLLSGKSSSRYDYDGWKVLEV